MFEKEIKRIYSHNLNKVKNLGSYINFEQLISANLHPAILQYISAEIDYQIFDDRQKILKNSVFDYSGEKIRHHFSQINKELKKNKRFSQQYISKLILHAASFNVNYLARPKWALLKFIYNNVQEKPTEEIKQVLNYIHYYAYLRKILTLYIEKKNIINLSSREFKELLTKVDESGLESNQSAIIDKALESMNEFFNVGASGKSVIPISAAKLFFQEKNLNPQLGRLNKKFGRDSEESFELEEIKNALLEKEPSLDEESEKIIKELVEQETGFNVFEPEKEETVNEAPEIEVEDQAEADENIEEDLGEGFVQRKLEPEEEFISDDPDEESTLTVDEEEEDEELIIIADEGDEQTSELNLDIADPDSNGLLIVEEVNNIEESLAEPVAEQNEPKSELRLVDNSSQMQTQNTDGINPEDTELEVSDDEYITEEPAPVEQEEDSADENEDETVIDIDNEEEVIEINDDVFTSDSDNENELTEEETLQAEEDTEEENSDNQIEDDDTLSGIIEDEFESDLQKIDMSDLVQNKKMTRIIEIVFDYDMEDYSNTIERISECQTVDDANGILDKLFSTNRISPKSKEAHLFRELISEYYK